MNDLVSNRPTGGAIPSPGARRMSRRNRRRKGLRCITIELRETEIDVLIRRRRLAGHRRVISPPYGRRCTSSLMTICGDAQQRPSDAP